jgi:hypothetical protein
MYNRYIPQPDGSYRRNSLPSAPQQRPQKQSAPPPQPPCEEPPTEIHCPAKQGFSAGDFLKKLLPKNLDTGDLLIIMLLLLMSADCEEEKNTALLTLALYLFM